jgi:hypothetical protein
MLKVISFKSLSFLNKYMGIIILIVLLVSSNNYTFAQSYSLTSSNKKALKYYDNAVSNYQYTDYDKAIEMLHKSIKYDNEFIEAWLLLGDAYTETDSKLEAISAYESAILIDSLFFPGAYYFLGNLNFDIGKYQEAVDNFAFLSSLPNVSDELLLLAYNRLLFAESAVKLVDNPTNVVLQHIATPVNTPNDEYINYVNTDKDYMMLTRRTVLERSYEAKPVYTEELLYSEHNDSLWNTPIAVNLPWKQNLDMGSLNLSADGRSMYFTGCYWPIGLGGCDLYVSQILGEKWLEPKNLGGSINTSNWESQPIISSDGKKLYFASKRKGGKGGSDIWMSIKLKNNSWSPPINLGDSINTSKDEMTPFLHADGRTLFFASTGHPGLGGYDLFISRQDELGRWSLAKNIGFPTNSRFNDINIFMSIDGEQSWISSDRAEGEGNMDIYTFSNYKELLPQKIMYVEGTVVDSLSMKPLKAKIQITNISTYDVVNTTFSDSITGDFLIVVYPGVNYAFNISKKGYLFFSESINIEDSVGLSIIKHQFKLSPFAKGNKLVMNNVFFKFNESELLHASTIELEKLVVVLKQNPDSQIEIVGHTDNIGNKTYNIELSLKRARSVGEYLISKGIKAERLFYVGLGATAPIASNNSDIGRAKNRRTEIIVK